MKTEDQSPRPANGAHTPPQPPCFYCGGHGRIDYGTEPGSPEIVEPCMACNGTGKESLWQSFCAVNDACNSAEYSGRFLTRLNASLGAVEHAVREHAALLARVAEQRARIEALEGEP